MSLRERIERLFGGRDTHERADAERLLLEADFGVTATAEILDRVAGASDGGFLAGLERAVAATLASPPGAPPPGTLARADVPPTVIVVCGVNGTGKTTTVAKLAHLLVREGRKPLLAAADTFRAAASDQLRVWADRLTLPCVGGPAGAGDPAAVAFDAVNAARARDADVVLIDTAGRLHTDERLLEELKKIVRVTAKAHRGGGAPHESLLVLEASTGQNAIRQGRAFAAAIPLTGLVVTKVDGSAKGGSVVALQRELGLPIRFLGTGEEVGDLELFDAAGYAKRLLGK